MYSLHKVIHFDVARILGYEYKFNINFCVRSIKKKNRTNERTNKEIWNKEWIKWNVHRVQNGTNPWARLWLNGRKHGLGLLCDSPSVDFKPLFFLSLLRICILYFLKSDSWPFHVASCFNMLGVLINLQFGPNLSWW